MQERLRRFSASSPCPICGGHPGLARGHNVRCWGFLSADGRWAHCTRAEWAGTLPAEASSSYAHRLDGPCRCGNRHGAFREISPVEISARRRLARYDGVPAWRDPAWRRAHTFYYHAASEVVVYRIVRWERLDHSAKRFIQERPDPASARGWRGGLGDLSRVPYRLPAMLRADPAEPVLIPEGEKQVDALVGLGFVATTNPEGARVGSWRPELSTYFRARHVVLLPDNDGPGMAHAREIATALHGVAASVRRLELPGLPAKGDICDWLDAGGTARQLRALLATAPRWDSTPPPGLSRAGTLLRYGLRMRYADTVRAVAALRGEGAWWRQI